MRTRLTFLFTTTRGLVLVAISLVAMVTAVWGMLSGPMVEWGMRDFVVRLTGMTLLPVEREGRIILLYHTIAMGVVAVETYLMTGILPMPASSRTTINATMTAGYITTMLFGLTFGYFGHSFPFHGLYLFGLSLVFFSGLLLAAALWPWRAAYHVRHPDYAHLGRLDLERTAFFIMAVATLGSAVFGAVTGSYWGSGHETFLAEDLIREPHKSGLQLAIIGHLHIMLTLIAIALALMIGRWFDFRGRPHKIAMPLMIFGTLVITLGAWAVVPFEPIAHTIIYVGSVMVMLAALFLVIFGFTRLVRWGQSQTGRTGFLAGLAALLRDPLRFGSLWQMVYMNFTVSGVGIFMAVKLDEIFRYWPAREERIVLTGHWHILSAIIATILLLFYAHLSGLQGRARRWFGWTVILGSDLAFAAVTVFEMKRLFVSESAQQPLVNWTMLLADAGLAALLLAVAILLGWRLVDLFKPHGRWRFELEQERPAAPAAPAPAIALPLEALQ